MRVTWDRQQKKLVSPTRPLQHIKEVPPPTPSQAPTQPQREIQSKEQLIPASADLWLDKLLPYLAPAIRPLLVQTIKEKKLTPDSISEIRLRVGRPLNINCNNGDILLRNVTAEELLQTLHLMSECSIYAFEEEFRQGYLTLPGGYRVGLAGRVVLEGGKVKTIHPVSSINIRIARQLKGIGDAFLPHLLGSEESLFLSTLILSPPGGGKTTLLRDLVRQLSLGRPDLALPGMTVGLVDERSEIAASYRGIPQNDVGPRTDVLDGCPKSEGLLRLLRSLAPKVLATDEIGRMDDVRAVEEAMHCGVSLLATAHGHNYSDLDKRSGLRIMNQLGLFQRIIILSPRPQPGTLVAIYNEIGEKIN
ncbi:stage III sporulation protein AA [Heliorestis acidaminivorans]|uniref:Stage III sporulation protein AA n=1 Tax=Heliorestis acidaminivorans TaxID=553427 RepID=A0A6I0F0Q3_9FIRM|nr:stage III sporulation protein AA [Heliorestis acidaminivorans]KAB2951669.1 stage III sporulation protein AA [Heliorestis acidaminivorans]